MLDRLRRSCVLLLIGVIFVASYALAPPRDARAQAIGNPTAANGWDTTSAVQVLSFSGQALDREIDNLIDGSGISGPGGQYNSGGSPLGFMGLFRNLNPDGSPNNTYSGRAHPGTALGSHWVEFKFDQIYNMGTTWLWNWNETPYHNFGWKSITIQYSTNRNTWFPAFVGTIPEAEGLSDSLPQLMFTFPQGAQAQYVVLTNTGFGDNQNWGAAAEFNDYMDAGLSEIRFFPAGAVVPALSPGDFNNNGTVGLDDYAILRSHFLQSGRAPTDGDLNGDGVVDLVDFVRFKQAYNTFNGGGLSELSPAVPEPGTIALVLSGTPLLLFLRRREAPGKSVSGANPPRCARNA